MAQVVTRQPRRVPMTPNAYRTLNISASRAALFRSDRSARRRQYRGEQHGRDAVGGEAHAARERRLAGEELQLRQQGIPAQRRQRMKRERRHRGDEHHHAGRGGVTGPQPHDEEAGGQGRGADADANQQIDAQLVGEQRQ